MKKPFILTFGSCGLDRIFKIDKDGTEKLVYAEEGKKNSHQAVAAGRAGAYSMLVSFVGDDEVGKICLDSLKSTGIDTQFIKTIKGAATELNQLYLSGNETEYTLKRFPSTLPQRYFPETVKEYQEYILKSDCVILVSKQPKDFLIAMIEFCYENNIPVALTNSYDRFDVNDENDLQTLRKVKFIACNFIESKMTTKMEDPLKMLKLLPNMLITSSDGVWFCDENGKSCFEDSVPPDEVVETNGAGDTFIGNFVVYYAEGKTKVECVRRSMCASTIEISKLGWINAVPFRSETDKLYFKHYLIKN